MYRSKSRALQSSFGRLRAVAHTRHVDLLVPKTELIHWHTPRQRDPPNANRPPPVALDGQLLHPSPKLRSLRYWFLHNLTSSAQISGHLALSQAAFASIRHLSSYGLGVSPHLCHCLAFSLFFPILFYGADLFVPSKGLLSKMDVHWRQVQRWVLNYFLATPFPILAAEACLPSLSVLLPHKRRMATLQLVCSPPQINPATARLCRSFPSILKFRAPNSYHPCCTQLDPNVMPLNWKTPHPSPPVRTHLPVDALTHLTLPLLEGLSFAARINSSLLLDLPPLSPDGVMKAAYSSLKTKARLLMLDSWCIDYPPPVLHLPSISYPPSFHGPGEVHGWWHSSDEGPEELPRYPPLVVVL